MTEMRQAQRHISVEEYVRLEDGSNLRHEYFAGQMFAMSGGSAEHNRITKNLIHLLDGALDRGCESYFNDLRVRTASGLHTYPDIFVVCGPLIYSSEDPFAVTNPAVIAEVLSDSTREYDRGEKFDLYRATATLRDYLLVDQYIIGVEHRFLEGTRWISKYYTNAGDVVELTAMPLALPLKAIYDRIDFSASRHDQ
jgi:Uma2 family endonuclease